MFAFFFPTRARLKKAVSYVLIFLFIQSFVPVHAQGARLQAISYGVNPVTVSTAANHTVIFQTKTAISSGTIRLYLGNLVSSLGSVAASDIDMGYGGTQSTADATQLTLASSAAQDTWGVALNTANRYITLTYPTSGTGTIPTENYVSIKIGTHATGGTNKMTNAATAGAKSVSIVVGTDVHLVGVGLFAGSDITPSANAPTTTPSIPTGFAAGGTTSGQTTLTWTDASDNETGFEIDRKLVGGTFALIATTAANVTSYTDTGLAESTGYVYRMRAINASYNSEYTSDVSVTTLAFSRGSSGGSSVPTPTPPATPIETPPSVTPPSDPPQQKKDTPSVPEKKPEAPPTPPPPIVSDLFSVNVDSTGKSVTIRWGEIRNADSVELERKLGGGQYATLSKIDPAVQSYNDSAVQQGSRYTYRLKVLNNAGAFDYSKQESVSTPLPPQPKPATPEVVRAILSSQPTLTISILWADTATNETGFEIQRRSPNESDQYKTIATGPANVAQYTDAAVQPKTLYDYRVRAINASGAGEYSQPTQIFSTFFAEPASPIVISPAYDAVLNTVKLTWTYATPEVPAEFFIQRRLGTETSFVGLASTSALEYSDRAVSKGANYVYRVVAQNPRGAQRVSNEVSITTIPPTPPAPRTPTDIKPTADSYQRVTIVWTDASVDESQFLLEKQTRSSGGLWEDLPSRLIAANATLTRDFDVEAGREYRYRVSAEGIGGRGTSDWVSVTVPTAPPPTPVRVDPIEPTNFKARVVSSSRIQLTWTDASNDETGFEIQRRRGDTGFVPFAKVSSNVTKYDDTTVSENNLYLYRIRAIRDTFASSYVEIADFVDTPTTLLDMANVVIVNTPKPEEKKNVDLKKGDELSTTSKDTGGVKLVIKPDTTFSFEGQEKKTDIKTDSDPLGTLAKALAPIKKTEDPTTISTEVLQQEKAKDELKDSIKTADTALSSGTPDAIVKAAADVSQKTEKLIKQSDSSFDALTEIIKESNEKQGLAAEKKASEAIKTLADAKAALDNAVQDLKKSPTSKTETAVKNALDTVEESADDVKVATKDILKVAEKTSTDNQQDDIKIASSLIKAKDNNDSLAQQAEALDKALEQKKAPAIKTAVEKTAVAVGEVISTSQEVVTSAKEVAKTDGVAAPEKKKVEEATRRVESASSELKLARTALEGAKETYTKTVSDVNAKKLSDSMDRVQTLSDQVNTQSQELTEITDAVLSNAARKSDAAPTLTKKAEEKAIKDIEKAIAEIVASAPPAPPKAKELINTVSVQATAKNDVVNSAKTITKTLVSKDADETIAVAKTIITRVEEVESTTGEIIESLAVGKRAESGDQKKEAARVESSAEKTVQALSREKEVLRDAADDFKNAPTEKNAAAVTSALASVQKRLEAVADSTDALLETASKVLPSSAKNSVESAIVVKNSKEESGNVSSATNALALSLAKKSDVKKDVSNVSIAADKVLANIEKTVTATRELLLAPSPASKSEKESVKKTADTLDTLAKELASEKAVLSQKNDRHTASASQDTEAGLVASSRRVEELVERVSQETERLAVSSSALQKVQSSALGLDEKQERKLLSKIEDIMSTATKDSIRSAGKESSQIAAALAKLSQLQDESSKKKNELSVSLKESGLESSATIQKITSQATDLTAIGKSAISSADVVINDAKSGDVPPSIRVKASDAVKKIESAKKDLADSVSKLTKISATGDVSKDRESIEKFAGDLSSHIEALDRATTDYIQVLGTEKELREESSVKQALAVLDLRKAGSQIDERTSALMEKPKDVASLAKTIVTTGTSVAETSREVIETSSALESTLTSQDRNTLSSLKENAIKAQDDLRAALQRLSDGAKTTTNAETVSSLVADVQVKKDEVERTTGTFVSAVAQAQKVVALSSRSSFTSLTALEVSTTLNQLVLSTVQTSAPSSVLRKVFESKKLTVEEIAKTIPQSLAGQEQGGTLSDVRQQQGVSSAQSSGSLAIEVAADQPINVTIDPISPTASVVIPMFGDATILETEPPELIQPEGVGTFWVIGAHVENPNAQEQAASPVSEKGGKMQKSFSFSVVKHAIATAFNRLVSFFTPTARAQQAESQPAQSGQNLSFSPEQKEFPITSFRPALTYTFTYTKDEIANVDEKSIKLYSWDPVREVWLLEPSTLDMESKKVVASISHLSVFRLFGEMLGVPSGQKKEIIVVPSVAIDVIQTHIEETDLGLITTDEQAPITIAEKKFYTTPNKEISLCIPGKIFKKSVKQLILSIGKEPHQLKYNTVRRCYAGTITTPDAEGQQNVVLKIIYTDDQIQNIKLEAEITSELQGQILSVAIPAVQQVQKTAKAVNANVKKGVETTQPILQAAAVAAVPVVTVANPVVLSNSLNILNYLSHLVTWLLSLLGLRRKRRSWGVVYNAISKVPIDLAIVRLFDSATKRLIETQVTDKNGRFSFLTTPGDYTVTVAKLPFLFPSSIIKGTIDNEYRNVYRQGVVSVKQADESISMSIPLDPPAAAAANVHATTPLSFFKGFFEHFSKVSLLLGFVLSIVLALYTPSTLNTVLLAINWVYATYQVFLMLKKEKPWGTVFDVLNFQPVPLAAISIFDAKQRRLLRTRLTDYTGRFTFLAPPGDYILTVSKESYQFPVQHSPKSWKFGNVYTGGALHVKKANQLLKVNVPIEHVTEAPREIQDSGFKIQEGQSNTGVSHRILRGPASGGGKKGNTGTKKQGKIQDSGFKIQEEAKSVRKIAKTAKKNTATKKKA